MAETRISLTKSNGWTRLGLPGAIFILLGTPMLWALGVFDATTEPLLHAIIFGLSGIFCFGMTPLLIGWALQGFVVRRKPSEDSDEVPAPISRPAAPNSGQRAPTSRPRVG